ncbi:MAG: adenylate/guanylate cyclase domain-containing protein [Geminicoccaceae bacterium]
MECLSCGVTLGARSKFCDECGAPVRAQCLTCGRDNRPDAKFCSECGVRLSAPGDAAASCAIEPSVSATPPSPTERRQLTVMMVDLVGSTALSGRLDPEDLREVIGAYHRCVAEVVGRHGGFVAKYMGDGVLVYFGWPRANEDDAERAVRAGLELVTAVRALTPNIDAELHSRIGIATGLVVVGDLLGAGAALEQAVVGAAPNLAARLQSAAEPDCVVIAASTRALAGGLFDYGDLGAVTAKGFAQPVRMWRVYSEGALASRFEALRSAETPLIGREEEIELLLRRWLRAKGGEGQAVAISGEPGIGKSRLAVELQQRIAPESHACIRYFCSPHQQDSVLHPIVAELERAAGFGRNEPPEIKVERLEALLARTTAPAEDVALLADLLSLPRTNRHPPLKLTPQRQKERTFEALVRQLVGLAGRHPVLMIVEDAHWSDPTSRDWMERVVERLRDLPILLVVTFRPEFRPPWADQAHVTIQTLNRLSRREGAALACRIAGDQELPGNLLAEIVERTDGVPLFVEELTRVVLDEGASDTDGGHSRAGAAPSSLRPMVPATLQASLLARLDRLGAAAKEIAQIGAAIGREFSFDLLADVARLPDVDLLQALEHLVASGLIFRRGSPPEACYLFKHALIQDAAYGTLLRSRREEWHARIATALELRQPKATAAHPELVAHHLTEAGRAGQAVRYWTIAGDRALARSAHHEASVFFGRAIATVGAQEETPETIAAVVDLRRLLHQALYPLGQLQHARANLAEAERAAEKLGEPVRLSRVLSSQIYLLATAGDLAGAVAAGDRVLALLAERDDFEAAVNTRLMLARALYAAGRYGEALGRAREAVAWLGEDVERGAVPGMNQTVSAHVWLTLCYAERGEFAAGAAEGDAAMRLAARPTCSEHDVLWSRVGLGRLMAVSGNLKGAIEVLTPALPLCEGELAVYLSRVAASLGAAYAGVGQIDKGLALLQSADDHAQAIGFAFGHSLVLAQFGGAFLLAGDPDRAREVGLRALAMARQCGERGNEAWALCLLGDAATAHLNPREAGICYRDASEIAGQLAMAPVQARCSDGLAHLASLDEIGTIDGT